MLLKYCLPHINFEKLRTDSVMRRKVFATSIVKLGRNIHTKYLNFSFNFEIFKIVNNFVQFVNKNNFELKELFKSFV